MLFPIHPPTMDLQLTLVRLVQRHAERCLELGACAGGERVAGLLRESVLNLPSSEAGDLAGAARDSASRQVDDLLGDSRRLGELAWQNQIDLWTGVQQAVLTWQAATFAPPRR